MSHRGSASPCNSARGRRAKTCSANSASRGSQSRPRNLRYAVMPAWPTCAPVSNSAALATIRSNTGCAMSIGPIRPTSAHLTTLAWSLRSRTAFSTPPFAWWSCGGVCAASPVDAILFRLQSFLESRPGEGKSVTRAVHRGSVRHPGNWAGNWIVLVVT